MGTDPTRARRALPKVLVSLRELRGGQYGTLDLAVRSDRVELQIGPDFVALERDQWLALRRAADAHFASDFVSNDDRPARAERDAGQLRKEPMSKHHSLHAAKNVVPESRRDHGDEHASERASDGATAFVLAGGVAKGAFAAGALAVLLAPRSGLALSTRRIVGASSGSLNAAYLAASVRAGRQATAGEELEQMWRNEATYEAFDVSLSGLVRLAGISSSRKLRELLARHIRPSKEHANPIDLRLVATNAAGSLGSIRGAPATTFEHVFGFDQSAFESHDRLEALFTRVCASAAFPAAFLPVDVEIGGHASPCLDGGLVNNCPLKQAIGDARDVSRVFVIIPYPRVLEHAPALRGVSLATHLAEMLIHERLYRDLREAEHVNEALKRLEHALPNRGQRLAALEALGWKGRKQIEVVEIRPPAPLAGGAFDGLFSRQLRDEYIAAGEAAARAWLAAREHERAA